MLPSDSPAAPKGTRPLKRARKVFFAFVRFGIGIGLIVYLGESGFIHFRDLGLLFVAWPLSLAALALILVHVMLISVRLSLLFRPQGLKLPFRTALRLTLVGMFFDIFLPGAAGGTVAKLFYATRENEGRRTEVATVVIFDRVIGIVSLLLLPLIFAPMFLQLVYSLHTLRVIVITYAAVLGSLLLVFLAGMLNRSTVGHLAGSIHFPRLRKVVSRSLETIGAYHGSITILLIALGLSLVANFAIVGVIGVALAIVNPASVAWRLCLVVPIGQIVNSLPITPGGLGVGEVAFNTLFRLVGLSRGAEALLCWRIWSAIVSGLGLYFYARGMQGCTIEAESAAEAAAMPKPSETRRSAYASEWRNGK